MDEVEMVLDWPGEHSHENDTGRLDGDDLGYRWVSLLAPDNQVLARRQLHSRLSVSHVGVG